MTIYAGNLSQDVKEADLRDIFRVFGQVTFVNIVKDRYNKISKGFSLVEMPVESEAIAAIAGLHGKELKGMPLNVTGARTRIEQ
ncbi:MAG: RNA-binding protein [Bacteroidota bacterium]|nr:RNA-binding protein [Bacteroidota bacterium]